MSGTIAQLGLEVDSSQAAQATTDLEKLTQAGGKAEKAAADMASGFEKAGTAATGLSTAEKQLADSTEDAKTRLLNMAKASLEASQYHQSLTTSVSSTSSAMQSGKTAAKDWAAEQALINSRAQTLLATEARLAEETKKAAEATGVQGEGLQKLLGKINPTLAALQKLDDQQEELAKYQKQGLIDEDTFKAGSADIDAARLRLKGLGDETSKFSLNTKGARENVLQLGNALAEGNIRVAAHNLLEIGASAGTSAIRLAALIAPFAALAAVVGVLGVAYYKGSEEADNYTKSLILTGNAAGVTTAQLGAMAAQVSATVGTTGQAAEVLATLAGNGKIAGESFAAITQAAVSMQEATGRAVSETVAEFVRLADEPVKASASLNEQYHYLTASVYSQIEALEKQGNHAGAVKLATEQFADAINERTPKILENLSFWEKGYNAVARAADSLKNIGRSNIDSDIAQAQSNLARAQNGDVGLFQNRATMVEYYQDQLNLLEDRKKAEEDEAKLLSEQAKIQQDAITSMGKVDALTNSALTNEEKRTKALKDYSRELDNIRKASPNDPRLAADAVAKNIANIKDQFKDSKTPAAAVNLTGFNDSKNALAGIVADYRNTQKELEAAQKAGLISQADYALKREALISNEREEVTAAYEAEISALEAAKGKASTSATQRIQLDQKIADARANMVKAQKEADSQLEVLATSEQGRLAKQERSIDSYVQALGQQQKALELAGQRAVLGVGRGDRQSALDGQLNSQQDRYAQQALDLENQRSDPSRNMSDEEFARKSQALADANKKATDQIRQNYADVEAAQGDWTKGATAAWENYLDSAKNIAGQTKSLFSNAFSSMEDAVVNFAMTGKASFGDFAKSIIADMARIATRQAASGLLSLGVSAVGSYIAGGSTTSAGSTQAGYSSTYFPQAKGGAWNNGVQMFANGAAFTNSIVSTPTAFGMANGKTGIMGEAGDEAVMPLTRTSSGALGVRAVGGGGTSLSVNAPVSVTLEDRSSEGMQLDEQALQRNMQAQMKAAAERAIAESWVPGGTSYRNANGRV